MATHEHFETQEEASDSLAPEFLDQGWDEWDLLGIFESLDHALDDMDDQGYL